MKNLIRRMALALLSWADGRKYVKLDEPQVIGEYSHLEHAAVSLAWDMERKGAMQERSRILNACVEKAVELFDFDGEGFAAVLFDDISDILTQPVEYHHGEA